jgi:hypothetical protein
LHFPTRWAAGVATLGCGGTLYVSNMAGEALSSPTGVNISHVLTKIYVFSFFIHWTVSQDTSRMVDMNRSRNE